MICLKAHAVPPLGSPIRRTALCILGFCCSLELKGASDSRTTGSLHGGKGCGTTEITGILHRFADSLCSAHHGFCWHKASKQVLTAAQPATP